MSGHPVLPAEQITLPLLPLRDVVVFPHMVIPLFVGRPKSIKALDRKTGARGLRSIMEQSLIDTMFDLPTLDGVAKVVLDEHTIEDEAKPLLVYREQKASA